MFKYMDTVELVFLVFSGFLFSWGFFIPLGLIHDYYHFAFSLWFILPPALLCGCGLVFSVVYIVQCGPLAWLKPWKFKEHRRYVAIRDKKFTHSLDNYGYKVLHKDEYGTLWYMTSPEIEKIAQLTGGSPVLWNDSRSKVRANQYLVEVLDPSTKDTYYLAVPPASFAGLWESAKAAVAWTFGMKTDEYFPSVQT